MISYVDSRYANGVDQNTFPTHTLPGQYGVTDIGYTVSDVPEPVSFSLAATGMLLVGFRRFRR